MFRDRVVAHYRRAGWAIEPVSGEGWGKATPDFQARKGARVLAVLVRGDEPPGPFLVGEFGANCRRRKIGGVIVAPDDAALLELCEAADVDLVPGESIGEVAVVGATPEPVAAPVRARVPVAVAPLRSVSAPLETAGIPWWRWAIVAAIWLCAVAVVAVDVMKLTS